MKYRNGFVSNSSSTSFILHLSDVTAKQLQQIIDYGSRKESAENWVFEIKDDELHAKGWTIGDLKGYCETINVDPIAIKWAGTWHDIFLKNIEDIDKDVENENP